jgi:hypothetical protein
MKFLPGTRADDRPFTFQLNAREEALLLATLRLYPVLDNSHYKISKEPKKANSSEQRLLEESMAQQRMAHRRKLDELFHAPNRYFKGAPGERRLVLTAAQLEWLLQVLNDIKVGSWVQLGCPEFLEKGPPLKVTPTHTRAFQAMQLSAEFQVVLLQAVK